jgi:parallel beta-helix repeat protein
MLSFAINIKPAKASEATQMLISPEMLTLPIGASFTVTINVTNVERLFCWQVILKYNGSVINCTDVWVPAENVFKGKIYAGVEPEFGKDYIDGYDYMMYGASLQGENFVNVDNGILFKANFTVINAGATRITFATKEYPVHVDHYTFESFLLDYDFNEISFDANFCTVKTPVITAIIVVPDDYPTIQEAINHAKDGDTVFVRSGIYYEHVVVNKTISLIGENRSDTIIDGSGTGIILDIVANGTVVRGFKIQNGSVGIYNSLKVYNCNIVSNSITNCYIGINCGPMPNSTVSYNEVTNCTKGIGILCNSTVVGNTLMNNGEGLIIFGCNNFLRNNTLENNEFNFGHMSPTLTWCQDIYFFNNDVDVSNTINGKPIYYWINEHDKEIPLDAAYVELVNCTNIFVHDLNLSQNDVSLVLANSKNCLIENLSIKYNNYWGMVLCCGSSNNIIRKNIFALNSLGILVSNNTRENMIFDNNIMENNWGIELIFTNCTYNNIFRNNITANRDGIFLERGVHDNDIYGNNISKNKYGLLLRESFNNSILHNNFVDNKKQIYDFSWDDPYFTPSINCWDHGTEGNYWSDYTGIDLNHDGIGDSWQEIDEYNIDHHPLMGMFHSFNTSLGLPVDVISNSTIESFQYFESNSTIIMYVFNMTSNQTFGFIRICIPHALMNETYHVTINGTEPYYVNYILYDNGTHRWIYFSYKHSKLEIIIMPEFPSTIILTILMLTTTILVVLTRNRRLKHCFNNR